MNGLHPGLEGKASDNDSELAWDHGAEAMRRMEWDGGSSRPYALAMRIGMRVAGDAWERISMADS